MLLAHAVAYAEARSYLAALADHALTFDGAMEYERVLLELDELHGGLYPPTTPIPEIDPDVLYRITFNAITGLIEHQVDAYGLALCVAMLMAARDTDSRL
ncbi:MAG: hypothetical protein ACSLEW_13965 [Nocardioides sp.]